MTIKWYLLKATCLSLVSSSRWRWRSLWTITAESVLLSTATSISSAWWRTHGSCSHHHHHLTCSEISSNAFDLSLEILLKWCRLHNVYLLKSCLIKRLWFPHPALMFHTHGLFPEDTMNACESRGGRCQTRACKTSASLSSLTNTPQSLDQSQQLFRGRWSRALCLLRHLLNIHNITRVLSKWLTISSLGQ